MMYEVLRRLRYCGVMFEPHSALITAPDEVISNLVLFKNGYIRRMTVAEMLVYIRMFTRDLSAEDALLVMRSVLRRRKRDDNLRKK